MKKIVALACIMASLVLSATACSINVNVPAPESSVESSAKASTEASMQSSAESSTESSVESKASTASATESSASESSQSSEKPEVSAAKIEGKIVNFDNMTFKLNDKTYTLGKTTLQDMMNDKVPFKSGDLDSANNNVKANFQETFNVVLNEESGWSAKLYFMNDTDSAKPAKDCWLQSIHLSVRANEDQNVLAFNFPLTMTKEQLFENAGEPTDKTEVGTSAIYKYKKESTKYYGNSAYDFRYNKGVLSTVDLSYLP